tara:strand:- start:45 stop:692 length:648 start_codon:yes stop_codon:yes gene_type:complete
MERKQGSPTFQGEAESFNVHYEDRLGGCALGGDGATYYPEMWNYMLEKYGIESVIDVGCGGGMSTDYFHGLGLDTKGVEGSSVACESANKMIGTSIVDQHDYEVDGPYIPKQEYDLCWSCEFVEHVNEEHANNFLETFKSCRFVAMTFAGKGQGGHHHVNEQPAEYWIAKLDEIGFDFLAQDTLELKEVAKADYAKYSPLYQSHFISRGLLFKRR